MNNLFSLKGKTALITGAGRGVGKYIANALAEAGANIILTSRNLKNLDAAAVEIESKYDVKTLPMACDIAREHEIKAMVEEATKQFPGLTFWLTIPAQPGEHLHSNSLLNAGISSSTSMCAAYGYFLSLWLT